MQFCEIYSKDDNIVNIWLKPGLFTSIWALMRHHRNDHGELYTNSFKKCLIWVLPNNSNSIAPFYGVSTFTRVYVHCDKYLFIVHWLQINNVQWHDTLNFFIQFVYLQASNILLRWRNKVILKKKVYIGWTWLMVVSYLRQVREYILNLKWKGYMKRTASVCKWAVKPR